MAYIPDMSCQDSKRARHRQRQARYEARQRERLPFSAGAFRTRRSRAHGAQSPFDTKPLGFEIALIEAEHRRHDVICSTGPE